MWHAVMDCLRTISGLHALSQNWPPHSALSMLPSSQNSERSHVSCTGTAPIFWKHQATCTTGMSSGQSVHPLHYSSFNQ